MRLFSELMNEHRNSGVFLECFHGEKDMKETTVIRRCCAMFNGDFFVTFNEVQNSVMPFNFDLDTRTISGLHPLDWREFVVYMCHILEKLLPHPYVSFVRDCLDEWVIRSPLRDKKDEIDGYLDALGITIYA
jgi:hypothetical protein